jgi:hypothetical protein
MHTSHAFLSAPRQVRANAHKSAQEALVDPPPLQAFFAVFYVAFGISQSAMAFPDLGKASAAVRRVFSIIDRKPQIDGCSEEGGS